MSSPTPPSQADTIVTVADVRFNISDFLGRGGLPRSFRRFQNDKADYRDLCQIEVLPQPIMDVPDPKPTKRWDFKLEENECCAVRRDPQGQTIWRLEGTPDFSCVKASWNPQRLEQQYGSYKDAWHEGLGLSVVGLRLRTLGGFLLHAMAAKINGAGMLGIGTSRSGKSTLSLLMEQAGACVLTDERPILRHYTEQKEPFVVYGTPWVSSAAIVRPRKAPLKAIYFLEHGNRNQIIPISPLETLQRLIPSVTIPWQTPALVEPTLKVLDQLTRKTPSARLIFQPTSSVYTLLEDDISVKSAIGSTS